MNTTVENHGPDTVVPHSGHSFLFPMVYASVVECLWSGLVGLSQNICSCYYCPILYNKKMLGDGQTT
jgi:hypothetical protein